MIDCSFGVHSYSMTIQILFHVRQLCLMSASVNNMTTFDVRPLPSMSVDYIWCRWITFCWLRLIRLLSVINNFDCVQLALSTVVVMHPKFDQAFSNWCVGKCVISAKLIVVHLKAIHFEVSKIISMDIILLKLLSDCQSAKYSWSIDLSFHFWKTTPYDVGPQ